MAKPEGLFDSSLSERFALREETFSHGDLALCITMPRAADELLDEEAFAKDERMPYWADLWPSAQALARQMMEQPPAHSRVIELGCGLALPSLVLKSRSVEVVATDHNTDALLFAQANARWNGVGDLDARTLDWRDERPGLGLFDLAIAADVLYEQRNAIALAALLPRILASHGRFVLADPNRRHLPYFQMLMRQNHWREKPLGERVETQRTSNGEARCVIRLFEFMRAEES